MMRCISHLLSLSLFVALLQFSGCNVALSQATATRTQSTAHAEGTQLVVQGVNGSIQVIAEPGREDVHVTAEITAGGATQEKAAERLADTALTVTRDTNRTLTISTDFPKPSPGKDTANLTIRIPAASDVRITNVNGAITVTGMQSALTLQTTNGTVTVRNGRGDASVTTVNGRIEFERHAGAVTARTTNGRIELGEHEGAVDVNTVNGRVTVALTPESAGPLQLRTTNGRIEASVGAGFAGEIEAITGNGSITISDGAGILRVRETDRRSGRAVFAREGAKSTLRTSNGSISLTTK